MNRQQRRATAATSRNVTDDGRCPCCNVRKVFLHAVEHADELRDGVGSPLAYGLDDKHLVADFGVLQIHHELEGAAGSRFSVKACGMEVLRFTPDDIEVERQGPWFGTLMAIRTQLDARFGPVEPGGGCGSMH